MESSPFTSARERRLWMWTLVAVAGIYSTIGLARALPGALPYRQFLGASFFLGMLVIGGAVVLLGLKTRPRGAEVGVALGIAAVYFMVLLRMAIPAERSHVIEYTVVALFIFEALMERSSQGRPVPAPWLVAVLATGLLGTFDECIQAFVPTRVFDTRDILFNVLAAVMAVTASLALGWARRRGDVTGSRSRALGASRRPR